MLYTGLTGQTRDGERWRPVLNEYYLVSSRGRVWSVRKQRVMATYAWAGYRRLRVAGQQMKVARLVCMAFAPPRDGTELECDHIDRTTTREDTTAAIT